MRRLFRETTRKVITGIFLVSFTLTVTVTAHSSGKTGSHTLQVQSGIKPLVNPSLYHKQILSWDLRSIILRTDIKYFDCRIFYNETSGMKIILDFSSKVFNADMRGGEFPNRYVVPGYICSSDNRYVWKYSVDVYEDGEIEIRRPSQIQSNDLSVYGDYWNLVNNTPRLRRVDGIISDFDGVVYDHSDPVVTDEMCGIIAGLLAKDVHYSNITGRPLKGLVAGFGNNKRISDMRGTYSYMALPTAGAEGFQWDMEGESKPIPGFPGAVLDAEAGELLSKLFRDTVEEVFRRNSVDMNSLKEGHFKTNPPYDFSLASDHKELRSVRMQISKILGKKIAELKKKGIIPDTVQVVTTANSVDIIARTKAQSAIEMIRLFGMRSVILFGDSVGTRRHPGNDRSILELSREDLKKAGIAWANEVDLIKIYAGRERFPEIPADVFIAPQFAKETEPAKIILESVRSSKDKKDPNEEKKKKMMTTQAKIRGAFFDRKMAATAKMRKGVVRHNGTILNGAPGLLRELTEPKECAANMRELCISGLRGKKIVLAFDNKAGGFYSNEIKEVFKVLEGLKKDPVYGRFMRTVEIVHSSAENMHLKLKDYLNDNCKVFVFAPTESMDALSRVEGKVQSIYIDSKKRPLQAYNPLPEIVAIALAWYIDQSSIGEIDRITDELYMDVEEGPLGMLIFTLLPPADEQNVKECENRYRVIRRFLSSA